MGKITFLSLVAAFAAVAFAGEPKFAPIKMVLGPGVQVATSITGARHLEAAVEKAINDNGSGPFTGNAFRDLVKKGEIFYSTGTTEVELCIDSKYTRPDLERVKMVPFFMDGDHSKVFYGTRRRLRAVAVPIEKGHNL